MEEIEESLVARHTAEQPMTGDYGKFMVCSPSKLA